MSLEFNDISTSEASYENVIVEVANEEIVTETECEEEPSETITIEVTVVDNDGTSEYVVGPRQIFKRSASEVSEDENASKKLATHHSTQNHGSPKSQDNERDVIISIEPHQVVDTDDQSSATKSSNAFKCFLCGDKTKFGKWSDLLSHFNDVHCTSEGFITTCKCPSCGLVLTLTQEGGIDDFDSLVLNVLSHMVREHDYSDDNVTTMTGKIDKDCAGKISCEKCGATVRADYMKKHLAQYCKGCKRVFECKCGRKVLPDNIPSHANVCAFLRTEKACTCPECGLIFKTVHNMELHFRRCHLKESRYSCEVCGEKFFKRDVLVQHSYVAHNINMDSREILYCSVENCDFTAIYAYHLNQHVRRQHEKGPFICDRCDKICNTYYTLNRHHCVFRQLRGRRVTSHVSPADKKTPSTTTGARMYKCSECNFTNASRKRVELHGRIHRDGILEENSGVSPSEEPQSDNTSNTHELQELIYCCGDCGFTSVDENVLREHLETVHSEGLQTPDQAEVKVDSSSSVVSVDTTSLPHPDAEAVSLLNHFKMGSSEVAPDSIVEEFEEQNLILEVVPETVPFQDETHLMDANTVPALSAASAVIEEVAQNSPDHSNAHDDPSILPKKSTTLAKNAPRLFHELTKSSTLMKPGKKKQTIVRPIESLQEYNIIFQNIDDHPTPPGQVLLLSPEDAAQLMIQQNSDVHID